MKFEIWTLESENIFVFEMYEHVMRCSHVGQTHKFDFHHTPTHRPRCQINGSQVRAPLPIQRQVSRLSFAHIFDPLPRMSQFNLTSIIWIQTVLYYFSPSTAKA